MWYNIPWQDVEYFATSYIIYMWQMNILGIFHGMEYSLRFFLACVSLFTCSHEHVHMSLFTHSLVNVITFQKPTMIKHVPWSWKLNVCLLLPMTKGNFVPNSLTPDGEQALQGFEDAHSTTKLFAYSRFVNCCPWLLAKIHVLWLIGLKCKAF